MGLDLDLIFGGVADTLINDTFDTPIIYIRSGGQTYDPATGSVIEQTQQFEINAGIEQISITEEGGIGETREIKLFIEHSNKGLPLDPSTGDRIEYLNRRWKVVAIDPQFVSAGLIASYITARSD